MMFSERITRREFFVRSLALAAVAVLLRYAFVRRYTPTWTLQAMLDHGIQIPPGEYRVNRTLIIRRDDTLVKYITVQGYASPILYIESGVRRVAVHYCTFCSQPSAGTALEWLT